MYASAPVVQNLYRNAFHISFGHLVVSILTKARLLKIRCVFDALSVVRLHVMVTVTCPHDPALQYRATSYTIEDALRRVVRLTANTRVAPWIEITLST